MVWRLQGIGCYLKSRVTRLLTTSSMLMLLSIPKRTNYYPQKLSTLTEFLLLVTRAEGIVPLLQVRKRLLVRKLSSASTEWLIFRVNGGIHHIPMISSLRAERELLTMR